MLNYSTQAAVGVTGAFRVSIKKTLQELVLERGLGWVSYSSLVQVNYF